MLSKMRNTICVNCGKMAQLMCYSCGERYCSKDCQARNWEMHRLLCIPPPLVYPVDYNGPPPPVQWCGTKHTKHANNVSGGSSNVPEPTVAHGSHNNRMPQHHKHYNKQQNVGARVQLRQNVAVPVGVPRNGQFFGSSMDAVRQLINASARNSIISTNDRTHVLTGFVSSNTCYVRDVNITCELEWFYSELNECGAAAPMVERADLNKWVLVPVNGAYRRAKLLDKSKDCARLLLIDSGHIVHSSWNCLREMIPRALNLPRFSMQLRLVNVPHIPFIPAISQFVSQFEQQHFNLICHSQDKFTLYNNKSSETLNEILRKFYATLRK